MSDPMDIEKPTNSRGDGNRSGSSSNKNSGRRRGSRSQQAPNNNKRVKRSNSSNNICFQFAKTGTCNRGDSCRFSHRAPDEEKEKEDETTLLQRSQTRKDVPVASTNEIVAAATVSNKSSSSSSSSKPSASSEKEKEASTTSASRAGKDVHITDQRFADLPISKESRRALADVFRYEFMTVVQAETLPLILNNKGAGEDCLAKAKTGTGKTLAFLIPTIERLLVKQQQKSNDNNNKAPKVSCLCISPTRELAMQISAEANSLTTFHKNIKVVTCVGGTNISRDVRALNNNGGSSNDHIVLVATPGRLLDHLQNTDGLAIRMKQLQVLILDEADQLLDMGFRPDIERILKILQPSAETRQTLLFSATVPQSVSEIASIALHKKYNFVDTVGHDSEQTHLHVTQQLMVAPQADMFNAIASILARETASEEPYKVIVFFTTARLTGFMAQLFNSVSNKMGYDVLEIHSRKTQPQRKKTSDKFRDAKNAVLFTSDVSARGMDYPGVTFVLQVGLTDRAQYIHRLGRTARAGREGRGALLLATYEERHMVKKELSDMPLEPIPIEYTQHDLVIEAVGNVSRKKNLALSAEQAYRAWLGYYNGALKRCNWNKQQLVIAANAWAKEAGLKKQPSLQKKTVAKMGLKGVPGLIIQ